MAGFERMRRVGLRPAPADYILPAYRKAIDAFVAGGGEKAIPLAILGVKREYLDAAFEEMETKYGTIEDYFGEGLGIDSTRQEALRTLYLGSEPRSGG